VESVASRPYDQSVARCRAQVRREHLMTTGSILLWATIVVIAVGAAFFVWKLWSSRQAAKQYARGKATADADVHHALQGKSFIVGTPSDFIDGDLQGHFRWLNGEGSWGLRLENPTASLRSLAGMSFPLWVLHGDEETWGRHPDANLRLKAYNTEVSLVLPKGLKEGDQIRLGDDAEDRANPAKQASPRL
jgi:hypothetical protein